MSDFEGLRSQAIALRRAGKSRREIKEELGVTSNWDLNRLLAGEAPHDATRRPNAKDELRAQAREMRAEGWTYDEIVAELGVSKSSVSLWSRDVSTSLLQERIEQQKAEGELRRQQGWEAWRAGIRREGGIQRQQTKLVAGQEIGDLSQRDVLMLGAIAYWCEGEKDKPHRRRERISFINRDPGLIRLFLRFLAVAGVVPEQLRFRIHIHENADLEFKRHNPETKRISVGDDYHGCLQVSVLRSTRLYRRIEGWAFGAMLGRVREEAEPGEMPTAESQLAMVHELRARARQEGRSQGGRSEEEPVE